MGTLALKRAFAWLFLSFLIPTCCCAQLRLSGRVRGGKVAPLPYAAITISTNGAVQIGSHADSSGSFMFDNLQPGDYQLSVYSLGYEKKILAVALRKDTSLQIILKPLSGALKTVTVVGGKPLIEQKEDRVVYEVAGNPMTSGSDGLEVLGKAPGIQVNINGIVLAGKGAAGVMVNGTLLHLSGKALTQYLQSLSASQISRIEIITHPTAAYEAEGGAGLINIVTRRSAESGLSGDVSGSLMRFFFTDPPDYGVSNFGYGSGSANLYYNAPKWSAYGNLSYTHGRELEGYGIDVRFPEKHWAMGDTGDYRHTAWNLIAGADFKPGKSTTIGIQYNYAYELYSGADHVNVPVYGTDGTKDSTLRTYAVYYPIALTNALNVHIIQQLKSGGKITLNGDYFNYYRTDWSHLETGSYGPDDQLFPGSVTRYVDTTKQNILIYTAKADLELPTPFAKLLLGGKLSFIHNYSNIYYFMADNSPTKVDSLLSNEFTYRENTQALYANASKELGAWKLDAGVRLEFTQTEGVSYFLEQRTPHHYMRLFPSLSATFRADGDNTFSLVYNRRINRPTFWTLNPYKSIMTPYSYVEGNPYLEPEYITNVELTHTFKKLLITTLYANVTDNGFTSVTVAEPDTSFLHTTPYNFISSRQFGLSETVTFSPWWWLDASGQLTGYYTKAHSSLPFIADVSGFGWYVASNNNLSLNKAKTLSAAINFWCQFPQVDHIGKSDTYYKLDLGFNVLTLKRKLSLSLNATDLLQSSVPTIHTTVNNMQETYTNFQVFSNVKLSATWHFGGNNKHQQVGTGNEDERERVN